MDLFAFHIILFGSLRVYIFFHIHKLDENNAKYFCGVTFRKEHVLVWLLFVFSWYWRRGKTCRFSIFDTYTARKKILYNFWSLPFFRDTFKAPFYFFAFLVFRESFMLCVFSRKWTFCMKFAIKKKTVLNLVYVWVIRFFLFIVHSGRIDLKRRRRVVGVVWKVCMKIFLNEVIFFEKWCPEANIVRLVELAWLTNISKWNSKDFLRIFSLKVWVYWALSDFTENFRQINFRSECVWNFTASFLTFIFLFWVNAPTTTSWAFKLLVFLGV